MNVAVVAFATVFRVVIGRVGYEDERKRGDNDNDDVGRDGENMKADVGVTVAEMVAATAVRNIIVVSEWII